MFFVLLFLILAASATYVFPDWSGVTVFLASLGVVGALRIILGIPGRTAKKTGQ